MTSRSFSTKGWAVLVLLLALVRLILSPPLLAQAPAGGQAAAPQEVQIPIDGWPKKPKVNGDTLTIYQPRIENWRGNTLEARAAVAVETPAAPAPIYGMIRFTARTEVDKAAGMVTPADFSAIKADFPVADGKSSQYVTEPSNFASNRRPMTIALERLQADLSVNVPDKERADLCASA